MSWTCGHCKLTTRAEVMYPVHCACGAIDTGNGISLGLHFVSSVQRLKDVLAFCGRVPTDVTAVAAVPRSGMFAGAIIAEQLHLALYSFAAGELVRLDSGYRHRARPDDGQLLVIDDTVASGRSLSELPHIERPHLTAVMYCAPEHTHRVDLYFRVLRLPHYLEWNLFNSIYTSALGTDIDGILCPDPPMRFDACGYDEWLRSAPLRQRPLFGRLPLVATGRRGCYREHTETWLARSGIQYDRLVMAETKHEWRHPADLKAGAYLESTATVFVESCPEQARRIATLAGKRVICPQTAEVWN